MPEPDISTTEPESAHRDETVVAGPPVVVRRNAGLAALVGAGASAIAIAYLWRANQSSAPLDWALCLVMAGVAATFLTNLVDARTPLLVADDLGVRIRLGNQWRGLPWDAVGKVVVQPRRGAFHDGRLMFSPHSLARALDGLDARGRRSAALNQKVYGAALSVPIGLSTRVSAQGPALADRLSALAQGRTDVVLVEPDPAPTDDQEPTESATAGRVVEPTPLERSAVAQTVDTHETDETDQPDEVDETADGDDSVGVEGAAVDGTAGPHGATAFE